VGGAELVAQLVAVGAVGELGVEELCLASGIRARERCRAIGGGQLAAHEAMLLVLRRRNLAAGSREVD
jgi:hypothetical protein